MASIGLAAQGQRDAAALLPFVTTWSGGLNCATILQDLADYEKILKVKRKLQPMDLNAFSKVDPPELESFVPAMIKAMLNSPPEYTDSQSFSILFPAKSQHFQAIATGGKPANTRWLQTG